MTPKLPLLVFSTLLTAYASAAEPKVITIKTLAAQMRYDVTEFTVSPGETVRVVFENADDLPHNLVFFQAGTNLDAVAAKNLEKPEEALKRDWLPDDPRMLAHSKAVAPKAQDEIVFKAPEKNGAYPFACTFPGHTLSMQGRMNVNQTGAGLTGLKFSLYLGEWSKLPDFAKLTPHREGPIADNLVQFKFDDYQNNFAVVYSAKLAVTQEGEYTFLLASDDGGRIAIDGKKLVDNDGVHPTDQIREGKVYLRPGEHDFRLEYFQAKGEAGVFTAWRGPNFRTTPLSKWVPKDLGEREPKPKKETPGIPLVVGKEPIIYRNFITFGGGRPIAVGYPGGFNLAWSASQVNLALVWRGAFLDAKRHWVDRGGGEQTPMGYDWLRPTENVGAPFAVLASPEAEWPASVPVAKKAVASENRAEGFNWKGYTLDAKRFPTFLYEWGAVKVSERFDVEGDATNGGTLVRTLKLAGPIPANAWMRIARGKIQPVDKAFLVDGGALKAAERSFDNKFTVAVEGAKITGPNLLVPARAEIKITYSWSPLPAAR